MNKVDSSATNPSFVKSRVSLKQYNTFSFDYQAEYLAEVTSQNELSEALLWANSNHFPVTVLGGGSNLLICGDVSGLVIVNKLQGRALCESSQDYAVVEFAAGEVWHQCVEWAVMQGLGGIENLALIPGSAGAAPVQNIGAYGVEIKDTLLSVSVVDRRSLELLELNAEQCGFGYRDSFFKTDWKDRYIITSIKLKLSKHPELTLSYGGLGNLLDADASIKEVFDCVCKIRKEKLPDPNVLPNSGSFFKNPVVTHEHYSNLKGAYPNIVAFEQEGGWKLAAGWLNDRAGWKGYTDQGVGVYEKQALVLVNFECSKADALLDLEAKIQRSVEELFNVTLEREPVLIGQAQ